MQELQSYNTSITSIEYSKIVRVARELAIDLNDVESICNSNQITLSELERLKAHPVFQKVYEEELAAWGSSASIEERIRLKSAIVLEEWLPELSVRLHNINEPLAAKIKGAELLRDMARIGAAKEKQGVSPGDMVRITINLGGDASLNFEKPTQKVIEHDPSDVL